VAFNATGEPSKRKTIKMAEWTGASPDPQADLEKLAAGLDGQAYAVSLVTGGGRRPHLTITNRAAAVLTENIYAADGWYWWGWAERIAPVADVAQAAHAIAQVLRAVDARR
jgi:hypothetical protein